MNNASKAAALGTKAFNDGFACIPILDQSFVDLLALLPNQPPGSMVGAAIPLLKAWVRAWNAANLAYRVTGK
jgi:hypothetical protein